MKTFLRLSFAVLLMAALQACSSSTSVEPAKEGKLVFGASVIDVGSVSLGTAKDTSIRISNTGTGDLGVTSTGASSLELLNSLHSGDTIRSGGYKDVSFHVSPSDTGRRTITDTIYYTTNGKTLSLLLTFQALGVRSVPGPGSTYTFSVVLVDTNGVPHIMSDRTVRVIANDLEYQGKTDVVQVIDDSNNVSYYHREANGDLATYLDLSAASSGSPITLPSSWYAIPIGSKSEIKQTLINQKGITLPNVPIPVDLLVESDGTYAGPQVVTGAGKSFATESGALKISVTVSGLGGLLKFTQFETADIWYSNDLAFYAKRDQVTQNLGSTKQSTETWTIKSYTLK